MKDILIYVKNEHRIFLLNRKNKINSYNEQINITENNNNNRLFLTCWCLGEY